MRLWVIAFLWITLVAQVPDRADLTRLIGELLTALDKKEFTQATDLASKLDDGVQLQYKAWLVRDSKQRVEDVLSWLPVDTEAILVHQEPFTVDAEQNPDRLFGKPTQQYLTDRLAAVDQGKFYRALHGRTIRLAVMATKGIPDRGKTTSTPALMPDIDVAYFYFLTEPVDLRSLPNTEMSVAGVPSWRATAQIDARQPFQPGRTEPATREDENWIALAKPDLLVLAHSRSVLEDSLGKIVKGSRTRALPTSLSEWAQVDITAPSWGLRHYRTAQLDEQAVGVTMQFDPLKKRLDMRYLGESQNYMRYLQKYRETDQFQTDQPEPGVLRLTADTAKRGDYPVHFAVGTLGFGRYR